MGTFWNRLTNAGLTSTLNLCYEQKYETVRISIWKISFLVVKFSVYLNRHVSVMKSKNYPDTLSIRTGPIKKVEVEESIRDKQVKRRCWIWFYVMRRIYYTVFYPQARCSPPIFCLADQIYHEIRSVWWEGYWSLFAHYKTGVFYWIFAE